MANKTPGPEKTLELLGPSEPKPKQREYKTIVQHPLDNIDLASVLNTCAKEGWRLVSYSNGLAILER